MKIKTRLRLNAWMSLVVVTLMMLSLAWSFWEIDRADGNEKLVEEMRKAAFERVSLRDDYLLYREERANIQWVAKSETLRGLMKTASERFTATMDKALLQEARKDFDTTFSAFSTLLEKHKREGRNAKIVFASDEAESRLIGQVFLKSYALLDSIGRLYDSTERAATRARTREFALIIFFIAGGIIAILVNSATLNRIVEKRMAVLHQGVGIIGSGNLDHRINMEGDDELSTLARASNQMAARLKETFTSVENLQLEITARKQAEKQFQNTLESVRKAIGVTIQVIVSAVETRDPYTAGHQRRVAEIACSIATEMGLPLDKIYGIRIAGSIHDLGKLSIPAEILSKPTKLSEIEFSLIKEHSQRGYAILKDVDPSSSLAEIVYQHHERMDGSGYPRKLKEDDILLESRILAVADVVEAIASHRPYRPALGIDAAIEEISKNRGLLYDPEVTDACLKLFQEKGYSLN
jgi:HD-GYP domain-containing protein (c-di-GMP phosphodiesterase class II)